MVVTLSEAKLHLRVTGTSEDSLISLLIQAATDRVENFINQQIPGAYDSPVSTPASIKAAVLLMVGDMFENREAGGEKTYNINPTVKALLYPYRVELGI